MKELGIEEAYTAMFVYLKKVYELTGSDDVGSLLGSMSTHPSGRVVDQALWNDWLEAVDNVKKGEIDISLKLSSKENERK